LGRQQRAGARTSEIGGKPMKIHEAIAYFEDAIRESDEIIAECSEALQKELTEQKGHFEVALEAMKKQIPQKVKKWEGLNETACPECGFAFGYYDYDDEEFDYCYNCGQKLDWESEVEKDNCKGSRYFRSQWIRVNCPHWESEVEEG
jgi:hypothetical protein